MITETGRVVAIESDHLWVETISRSACGNCAAEKGCGQSLLARWAEKNSYLKVALDGRNAKAFKINDAVTIGIPEDVVLKSSLLMYCLPVITLLTGGSIGHYGFGSDAASAVMAIAGLLAGGMLVKLYSAALGRRRKFQPVVVDLLGSASAPVAQAHSL